MSRRLWDLATLMDDQVHQALHAVRLTAGELVSAVQRQARQRARSRAQWGEIVVAGGCVRLVSPRQWQDAQLLQWGTGVRC
jgi:hypothetical protein